MQVLTSLEGQLYLPGDVILRRHQRVDNLIFFERGKCNLYGFHDRDDETVKMLIVRLSEGSWYGDFQILTEHASSFQLEAGSPAKYSNLRGILKDDELRKESKKSNFVHVFTLKGTLLRELVDDFPEMIQFLQLRATMRRTHFLMI